MVSPDSKIDSTRDSSAIRSSERDVRRKPPTRDFNQVAEQVDERRYEEEEIGLGTADKKKNATARKAKGSAASKSAESSNAPSPFELARSHRDAERDGAEDAEQEMGKDAVAMMDTGRKNHPVTSYEDGMAIKTRGPDDRLLTVQKKRKDEYFGAIEQSDLATVNPLGQTAVAVPSADAISTTAAKPVAPLRSLQEIIDQIVKEVYTLEHNGKSETVIELRGAFAESRLIITKFDSATHEMNITIDNLTAKGKEVLDAHKSALIDDLHNNKIVVHIFTTSTALETPRLETSQREDGRGDGQSPRDNQDRDRREKRNR